MRRSLLAAAFVPLLASCGGPVLFGEVTIPELRVGLPGLQFVATAGAPPEFWCDPTSIGDPMCLARTFDYDFGDKVPLADDPNASLDLRLTAVTISLLPPAQQPGTVTDLALIDSVTLRLLDPAHAGDPMDVQIAHSVVIASYVRTEPAPTVIEVSGNANTNLGPYLLSGKLSIRAELTYQADSDAFVADVEGDYSLVLKYDYWSKIF